MVTAAGRDLAANRDPFISLAHLTEPERWPLLEVPYTKRWLLRHVAILNIGSQWHDPEILLLFFLL